MTGAEHLALIMMFGSIVIGLFALIFLFYTNSFLIKRRKKRVWLVQYPWYGKAASGAGAWLGDAVYDAVLYACGDSDRNRTG